MSSNKASPTKKSAESGPGSKSKVPNNGHICMNASESKALNEILSHEKNYSDKFKLNLHHMTRSRNPLLGEPTPREGEGELIISSAPLTSSAELVSKRYILLTCSSELPLIHIPLTYITRNV